jgi:processive 1,2-diacylglycerol beta-glucosyltransferase
VRRVLILTASVGEGHDLPARLLAERLSEEAEDVEVVVADGLRAMGRPFVLVNERAPGVVFHRLRWLWDVGFWLFVGVGPTRRLSKRTVQLVGAPGLLRVIRRLAPDVVVSVYPVTTEVLGALRRTGRLAVPAIAAITDLAMMHYWAAPGIDLHLVTHAESTDEVRQVAGATAAVVAVRGLLRREFELPRNRGQARRALRLPLTNRVVLVSGGGWGVGDLAGAIDVALAIENAIVVCLCGRNLRLQTSLAKAFKGERRLRLVGFTDQMSDWLAAVDVLVHSTGGLTVLEALIRGCPVISYGWGRGHLRANNDAFRRLGLARVVETKPELHAALAAALAADVVRRPLPAELPSAASVVLAEVERREDAKA